MVTEKIDIYNFLCSYILDNKPDKIQEVLQTKINLNFKLDLDIAMQQYNLYVTENFSQENLSDVKNNLLTLTNNIEQSTELVSNELCLNSIETKRSNRYLN